MMDRRTTDPHASPRLTKSAVYMKHNWTPEQLKRHCFSSYGRPIKLKNKKNDLGKK